MKLKAGMIITGSHVYRGVPLLVTAVGMKRFLFVNMTSNRHEQVAMIDKLGNEWRKWSKTKWPDEQYRYVLERPKDRWGIL